MGIIKYELVETIKILGAVLELPAPIPPILSNFLVNGPNWQCCLAGSSKMAPRIFFSIVLGPKYSLYVKSIATYAPQKVLFCFQVQFLQFLSLNLCCFDPELEARSR